MPFTPINITNGVTPVNATWGTNAQIQYTESTLSFNPDLLTAFVVSGLVATKDGSIANQLDVTSGNAYLLQTDGTTRQRKPAASTPGQFTTSTINTTYYLFLNNDGTWTWSTTSTGPANSLAICQATTDGSGNILVVSDKRTLATTLLSGMLGLLTVPPLDHLNWGAGAGGSRSLLAYSNANHENEYWAPQASATAQGHLFLGWNGSAMTEPLSLGSTGVAASTAISDAGAITKLAGQATAGSFGVPVIVAQATRVAVTVTTNQHILDYSVTATGFYRVSGYARVNNGTAPQKILVGINYNDPDLGNIGQSVSSSYAFITGTTAVLGVFDGTSNSFPNGVFAMLPLMVNAATGTTLSCRYQDPAGTPNDLVTFIIERMA